ncbi:Peptidyl-prolyl cis-trans isomerase FKBP2 [Toxocara canis]|uniref:Peptidyl-prolyl cis-trans isomerase FKBP2 n=1 Tax=Toxocara canis TaxID=6265 RepID=A0A0B2UX67_TOXCA|nr:Peptidyl-prolyl cis-trans isomerase FKBP2 [Toxocara canis]
MLPLCVRLGRICEIAPPAKTISCYASTSKAKEDSLPSGYRKTPPFAFFLKENYAKKDGVKVTEAMVELKNRWNSLSAIEKKKYFDESAAELKEKKAKFDALGVEEKQRLREESERNREKRVRRRIRAEKAAKREESHRPVRPPSAYNLYIKEKMGMAQRTPEQQRLKFKEFAAAWKTLPEKEKQEMRSGLLCVSLSLVLMCVICEEKKVARLQIGVKKRAEKCDIKSKKGDVLHMHYTVSILRDRLLILYVSD